MFTSFTMTLILGGIFPRFMDQHLQMGSRASVKLLTWYIKYCTFLWRENVSVSSDSQNSLPWLLKAPRITFVREPFSRNRPALKPFPKASRIYNSYHHNPKGCCWLFPPPPAFLKLFFFRSRHVSCRTRDLSSPSRNWICVPCIESMES